MSKYTESKVVSKAVFSENMNQHRYILKRVWNSDKPIATFIMLNPTGADALIGDKTLMLIMNFLVEEDFGGFFVINIFSRIAKSNKELVKINYLDRWNKKTDRWTRFAIKNSGDVFIAWGSNKNRMKRISLVIDILKDCNVSQVKKLVNKDESINHLSRLSNQKNIITVSVDEL